LWHCMKSMQCLDAREKVRKKEREAIEKMKKEKKEREKKEREKKEKEKMEAMEKAVAQSKKTWEKKEKEKIQAIEKAKKKREEAIEKRKKEKETAVIKRVDLMEVLWWADMKRVDIIDELARCFDCATYAVDKIVARLVNMEIKGMWKALDTEYGQKKGRRVEGSRPTSSGLLARMGGCF